MEINKIIMNQKNNHSLFVRALEKLTSLSYPQLFLLWTSLTLLFAFGYFSFASIGDVFHHGPEALVQIHTPLSRFLNSLYYSIITATSTGYGDITPRGFSKALAAMQSMSALFIFAVFVTKLVSHRQEVALREVYRLTFEDVFHNIREGLFVIRKDFDGLIEQAHKQKKIHEEDWDTLVIAYKQAQSLLSEIPDFYNEEDDLYTLDARREQLLHEAVHRTMHRINQVLDAFSKNNVDWQNHENSMQELEELMRVVEKTMPLWQERSPYNREEAFMDILDLKNTVVSKIVKTIPGKI
jgi:potassium channel LctB